MAHNVTDVDDKLQAFRRNLVDCVKVRASMGGTFVSGSQEEVGG